VINDSLQRDVRRVRTTLFTLHHPYMNDAREQADKEIENSKSYNVQKGRQKVSMA